MIEPYFERDGITIYLGDCREILPTLGKFDLCLTDPPYGIGENAKRVASRRNLAATTDYGDFTWDSSPPDYETFTKVLNAAWHSVIWGGNYFNLPVSRGWLVWDKINTGDFADCELAWTNCKTAVRIFRFMWNGMLRDGEQRGVKRVHPTQKPTELMTWCLRFAPDAKTVIDPFMGSGTTLVACKLSGLSATGIEISEAYCEIAARRLEQGVLNFDGERA